MPNKGTGGSGSSFISRMGHNEILTMTEPFVNALVEVAPNTPALNPWPSCVPTPPDLKTSFDTFRESNQAAQSGHHLHIAQRNDLRLKYNSEFTDVRDFVLLAARKDPSLIVKTQMDLWKTSAATVVSQTRSFAPKNLSLKHGPDHGLIIASTASVPKAKSFELHMCEADPTVEENWKFLATYPRCSKMEVRNLQPGKLYYFRVRAVLPTGYGPWSANATLMAI
jgi:hypothetical protein